MPIIVVTLFSHFSLFFFLQSRYLYFNLYLKQRRFCLCRHQAHDQSHPMSLLLWIFFSLISCLSLMTPELIYNVFHLFLKYCLLSFFLPYLPYEHIPYFQLLFSSLSQLHFSISDDPALLTYSWSPLLMIKDLIIVILWGPKH